MTLGIKLYKETIFSIVFGSNLIFISMCICKRIINLLLMPFNYRLVSITSFILFYDLIYRCASFYLDLSFLSTWIFYVLHTKLNMQFYVLSIHLLLVILMIKGLLHRFILDENFLALIVSALFLRWNVIFMFILHFVYQCLGVKCTINLQICLVLLILISVW